MSAKGYRSNEMCIRWPISTIPAHLNFEDGHREASMMCCSNLMCIRWPILYQRFLHIWFSGLVID